MLSLYKNILSGGSTLETLKNVPPQQLLNFFSRPDVAIVNALSDDILIKSSKPDDFNSFGENFSNKDKKELDNYSVIVVYCANYTCSASKTYINELKEKFPGFNGNYIDYEGGVFEWGMLSLLYDNFNIFSNKKSDNLDNNELYELLNNNIHRIKDTNIEFLDSLQNIETLVKSTTVSVQGPPIIKTQLLEGKVCVVTGGTSGLGLQTIKCMLDNGAKHVTGTWYNNKERADKVSNELIEEYGKEKVLILRADARTEDGNLKTFGSKERADIVPEDCIPVDCVDINAGIFGPASYNNKHIHQIKVTDYDDVLNLNLKGYVLGVQAFIKQAIEHKIENAAIVCIKSIYGTGGSKFSNSAYQISKHGTMGLVNQVAIEFARPSEQLGIPHKIRINAVSPTFTTTALTKEMLSYDKVNETIQNSNPTGVLADKACVANAVCWLLSDIPGDVTGCDLPVDCGVLSEVVPTISEVEKLNFEEGIEFLSCCGDTPDRTDV